MGLGLKGRGGWLPGKQKLKRGLEIKHSDRGCGRPTLARGSRSDFAFGRRDLLVCSETRSEGCPSAPAVETYAHNQPSRSQAKFAMALVISHLVLFYLFVYCSSSLDFEMLAV